MRSFTIKEKQQCIEDLISATNEPWQRKERLRYIDAKLFWTGTLRREDICKVFELHTTNASKDIQVYLELAGNNLTYDRRDKVYRATPVFKPISRQHEISDLLAYTSLDLPWLGYIPDYLISTKLPLRQPSSIVTRNILLSIHENTGIEVTYLSMNNPEGVSRVIYPRAVIFDGLRWHTRAYDERTSEYRDFVLSRINGTGARKPERELPIDADWGDLRTINICPHRKLSETQKKMIEQDYAMQNGKLLIETRLPLAAYLIRMLNLDTYLEPPRQQLECSNLEEFRQFL